MRDQISPVVTVDRPKYGSSEPANAMQRKKTHQPGADSDVHKGETRRDELFYCIVRGIFPDWSHSHKEPSVP